ncbi:MAG TPA: hypothetical protein VGS21_05915 [Acidimicrobiales bacterium]|nr:hypothetical protein [Acidimicrobiales bacterium]
MATISGTSKRTVRMILAASASGMAIAASLGIGAAPAGAATTTSQRSHIAVAAKPIPGSRGWAFRHGPDNHGWSRVDPDNHGWTVKRAPDNHGWNAQHGA